MKKYIICLLFISVSTLPLAAQQTVGISNPENIEPILDYRLPDWGFTNYQLRFNFRNRGFNENVQSTKSSSSILDIGARPSVHLYKESEERIFSLRVNMNLNYRFFQSNQQESNLLAKSSNRDNALGTSLRINSYYRKYISSNNFLYFSGNFNLTYQRDVNKQKIDGQLDEDRLGFYRRIEMEPRIGYGIGRIRNVNPIIRALRLRERIKAVNADFNLTDQDIQNAAEQITRYDGYSSIYDRPEKYFWQDMDDAVSADLSSLGAFEMLFLTDVLDEYIGTRREGWEIIGGASFNYSNTLNRDEDHLNNGSSPITDRTLIARKTVGPFVSGRWYKNTSLRQQYGVFGDATLYYPIGKQGDDSGNITELKRKAIALVGVNYLFNITDRILFTAEFSELYTRTKSETTFDPSTEYTQWRSRLQLATNLNFYIENDLSLNFSVRPTLIHLGLADQEESTRIFRWNIGVGFIYSFGESLY